MVKRYCDRCGMEINEKIDLLSEQTQARPEKLEVQLSKVSTLYTFYKYPVDLCEYCERELKLIISDFLNSGTAEKRAFAAAHECCGGCVD